ncbi:hypothetical protein STEG23_012867 [Scotinomys teguina]
MEPSLKNRPLVKDLPLQLPQFHSSLCFLQDASTGISLQRLSDKSVCNVPSDFSDLRGNRRCHQRRSCQTPCLFTQDV